MSDEWVTLRTFSQLWEAEFARETLEAEGIQAFVPDECMASIQYPPMGMSGGVRLQVRADRAKEALSILSQEQTSQETSE